MNTRLGLASAALLAASLTACSSGSDTATKATTSSTDRSPSSSVSTSTSTSPTAPVDNTAKYCAALKQAQTKLGAVDFSTLTNAQWDARRQQFADLRDIAPSTVKDDWTTSVTYFDKFNKLLASAGLTVEDIKTLQANKLPPGVDKAKVLAIVPKMQQLQGNTDLSAAQQAIRDNAKKECHITLGSK